MVFGFVGIFFERKARKDFFELIENILRFAKA